MSLQGADTTHALDIGALKRAGVVAVGGYGNGSWKKMSKPTLDGYLAAGLGVWLCWETTTTRALQGRAAGAADAVALNSNMDALGCPLSMAACWTLDTDVPNDGQAASEYAYGWHQASKRPSATYAEASVIDAGIAAGVIVTGWQSNARSWSAGRRSTHASIFQGVQPVIPDTDPDEIVDPHSPLIWWPFTPATTSFIASAASAPVNNSNQTEEQEIMSAAGDIVKAIVEQADRTIGEAQNSEKRIVAALTNAVNNSILYDSTIAGNSAKQVQDHVDQKTADTISYVATLLKDTEGRLKAPVAPPA
jgi:hypothetical protein